MEGDPIKVATNFVAGLSNRSNGVPICSIIPSFIITIRSAKVIAST